jgi:hypothetical protein
MLIPNDMSPDYSLPVLRVRLDRRKKQNQQLVSFLKGARFRLAIRHIQGMNDAKIIYKGCTYRGTVNSLGGIPGLILALLTKKT